MPNDDTLKLAEKYLQYLRGYADRTFTCAFCRQPFKRPGDKVEYNGRNYHAWCSPGYTGGEREGRDSK